MIKQIIWFIVIHSNWSSFLLLLLLLQKLKRRLWPLTMCWKISIRNIFKIPRQQMCYKFHRCIYIYSDFNNQSQFTKRWWFVSVLLFFFFCCYSFCPFLHTLFSIEEINNRLRVQKKPDFFQNETDEEKYSFRSQ